MRGLDELVALRLTRKKPQIVFVCVDSEAWREASCDFLVLQSPFQADRADFRALVGVGVLVVSRVAQNADLVRQVCHAINLAGAESVLGWISPAGRLDAEGLVYAAGCGLDEKLEDGKWRG